MNVRAKYSCRYLFKLKSSYKIWTFSLYRTARKKKKEKKWKYLESVDQLQLNELQKLLSAEEVFLERFLPTFIPSGWRPINSK